MRTNDIKGKVTLPFCRSEEAAFCLSLVPSLPLILSSLLIPFISINYTLRKKQIKEKKAQSYWSLKKKKIGAVHRQMLAVSS